MAELTPDPLLAAERGLAVFPIPPGGNRPADHGWQRSATRDVGQIRRRWRPGDNVGVGCRASSVVGIDLDRHDGGPDGVATFAALCARLGRDWPDTLTVATPTGGLHLYFRVPTGHTIVSTSGGRSGLGAGIDTRGPGRRTGGYLVGPGSVVNGVGYRIDNDTAIAGLPSWLTALLDDQDGHQPADHDGQH